MKYKFKVGDYISQLNPNYGKLSYGQIVKLGHKYAHEGYEVNWHLGPKYEYIGSQSQNYIESQFKLDTKFTNQQKIKDFLND